MARVISVYLPTWPTDRLRRQAGDAASPVDVPLVLAGRVGGRRVLTAVDDAARVLGCSWPKALWRVLVPAILPGFMSGGLFAFIASFDNYPVSMFLTDVRTKTLPIQLLNQLEMSPDPTLAAVSTLLITITIGVLFLCDRLVGLRRMASM